MKNFVISARYMAAFHRAEYATTRSAWYKRLELLAFTRWTIAADRLEFGRRPFN